MLFFDILNVHFALYVFDNISLSFQMDCDWEALSSRLQSVQDELHHTEKPLQDAFKRIAEHPDADPDDRMNARQEYYKTLSVYEQQYQTLNQEYKDIIKDLSEPYLKMSEFYVGPELPRHHYLSSPKDVSELYMLFLLAGIASVFGIK